jgi:hypothetical protein
VVHDVHDVALQRHNALDNHLFQEREFTKWVQKKMTKSNRATRFSWMKSYDVQEPHAVVHAQVDYGDENLLLNKQINNTTCEVIFFFFFVPHLSFYFYFYFCCCCCCSVQSIHTTARKTRAHN